MAHSNVVSMDQDQDYPLANSEATRMLAEAIKRADEDKSLSQRGIAKLLNYKSSVVVSHMASGRVAIPVDRALEIARLLQMDPAKFLLAVLQQRHPDIDFVRILSQSVGGKVGTNKSKTEHFVLDELEAIAGRPLDELPVDKVNVLREVVGDPNPQRRWIGFHELPTIELVRQRKPQGVTPAERIKLGEFLDTL